MAEEGTGSQDIETFNSSWEKFSGADISLIAERKFVENESGEKILMEKEYFSKYYGTTIDTWGWVEKNGEIQKKQVKNFIEWESDGVPNPFELLEPKYYPSFKDEIGPPPVENARLIEHKFEGWINDAVLWSRWKVIAQFQESSLEDEKLIIEAVGVQKNRES